jgi:carboxylate-amine ligase
MMADTAPALTIGIEEEYLLVDPVSRDLAVDPPEALLKDCQKTLGDRASPEFMRCQIEVGTPVCDTIAQARHELAELRRTVIDKAGEHGLAMIAASTHPFATWRPQKTTERDRYEQLAQDIGTPVRRLLICALHVHVGIQDPNLRIDLMNQMRYFLPHLLALSTSSPFWQGEDTNLMSYRLAVFNELPRTGLPEEYASYGEYEQHLAALVATRVIEDGTKIWWDIRPSARFPTLEMRICDVCTRMEDSLTVVALYVSLIRMLWRLKRNNITWRRYKALLINENRWRAMRYGANGGLIDFGRREMVPYPDLLEELLELVAEDAAALGCEAEVARARAVAAGDTSAHNQRRVFAEAMAGGASRQTALTRVVDWLIDNTARDL